MSTYRFLFLSASALVAAGAVHAEVDYVREVKPLLRERCYSCHGALKQEGGLRLDTAALLRRGGETGSAVTPGDAAGSLVIQRVSTSDLDDRMPPEHEGEPFKAAEIQVLAGWIAAGAVAPAEETPEADPNDHWAFRSPVKPPVPAIDGPWGRHPIDALIAKQHRQHGLTPQQEAPREVVLRRLYFDLIGLPPSAAEVTAALGSLDDRWYEAVVEKLLADPRHGERWARHWMDVWRYSDWWGLGDQLRNSQKHIWHWRDWIIESLNGDLSYAEMVRLMLSADERHPGDLPKLRATGFLARNYFLFNRHQWMEETVEHVGKGLLGLTINCAKCHDHKYDPVSQPDYYRLRAFFEPYHVRLDMVPGENDLERDGVPRVYDGWLEEPTWRFIRGEESRPDKSTPMTPGVPGVFTFRKLDVQPVVLPPVAWQPERQPWVIEAHVGAARKAIEVAEAARTAAAEALVQAERLLSEHEGAAPPSGADQRLPAATPGEGAPAAADAERGAAEAARARLKTSEHALALAMARLRSIEARGVALRAEWSGVADAETSKAEAVRAERDEAVATARHAVAEKEGQWIVAMPDKKQALEMELAAAREACAKAEQAATAPIGTEAGFARLSGAKWTPTRFRNSTADDPDVPFPAHSSGRRSALADWMVDPQNPLTARVAVNHLWARHMGSPLVATVFDFGRKGAAPTHPELLDWLAVEFMENGWSMQHLHRLILTSTAYRLSSSLAGGQAAAAIDPDNRHLWRRTPGRLEAELVRDAILAHTGEMDPAMGGPPVPPAAQEESKRRSLYFYHSNNDRNIFLTTFDGAAVKECYRREQSIVPQQALALSNSRLVQDASRKIADRFSQPGAGDAGAVDEAAFVRRVWLELLSVRASDAEVAASLRALAEWRSIEPADPAAARAHLVWTLLNHTDFVTQR